MMRALSIALCAILACGDAEEADAGARCDLDLGDILGRSYQATWDVSYWSCEADLLPSVVRIPSADGCVRPLADGCGFAVPDNACVRPDVCWQSLTRVVGDGGVPDVAADRFFAACGSFERLSDGEFAHRLEIDDNGNASTLTLVTVEGFESRPSCIGAARAATLTPLAVDAGNAE
jgi:hypothetical protein